MHTETVHAKTDFVRIHAYFQPGVFVEIIVLDAISPPGHENIPLVFSDLTHTGYQEFSTETS